jgi:hypothetical protein
MVAARRLLAQEKVREVSPRESWAWSLFSLVLWLLAVNKQLDFQTAFTELGLLLAREQGWYSNRAHFQKTFIAGLCGTGVSCIVALMAVLRGLGAAVKVAALGMCFIGVFVKVILREPPRLRTLRRFVRYPFWQLPAWPIHAVQSLSSLPSRVTPPELIPRGEVLCSGRLHCAGRALVLILIGNPLVYRGMSAQENFGQFPPCDTDE